MEHESSLEVEPLQMSDQVSQEVVNGGLDVDDLADVTTGESATGESATGESANGESANGESATEESATEDSATGYSATGYSATEEFAASSEAAAEGELDEEPERTRLPVIARVSSLLFVSTKPLTTEQLAEASGSRPERVEEALEQLQSMFDDQVHGFSLQLVAAAWQFRTAPAASTYVHRLIPKTARKLSRAAAETLAVVAYKQPVQRAEIEAIRGVDALPTLKTLLDAKLIRIVGREQTAGHPALYGTTKTFLEKFGLADLSELPSAKELAQFLDEPGEVDEENDATPRTVVGHDDDFDDRSSGEDGAEDAPELQ